ncbi:MAG TPA: DUF2092 domain-containing protein [Lacipirellulaceae bacterium]|nr:DUF2092 domain-containing protein [Lacipirellulaceae bacterium]
MVSVRNLGILVLTFSATVAFQSRTYADPSEPKPETVLRQMADYLGKLPAFSCRIEAVLDLKFGDDAERQDTKMTLRLQRPNRLAMLLDDGEMGLVTVSNGKQLVQCLPILKRYVVGDVPANYAEMTDVGVPLKFTILGSTGALIPTSGEPYYKKLVAGVIGSKYLGKERMAGAFYHHLRFMQKQFDWDIWIEDGTKPTVGKVVIDLSKQLAADHGTGTYTVMFSDWNLSPKFTDADFAFKKPPGAEEVDVLIEPDPPHPLLGKSAPNFKTVDLENHPFELQKRLGKNVVLLDFWATWCGPCVMAMPKIEEVAKKYEGRGLVFQAVDSGEDAATIKDFLKSAKLNPPVVMDPETQISKAYAVDGIPQTVLIGKDGKVQVVHQGYSDDLPDVLSKEIEALLSGKDLASEALAKARKGSKKHPRSGNDAASETETPSSANSQTK